MFLLAKIVLHYVNGEEIWKCDACGKKVYAELKNDVLHTIVETIKGNL